MKKNRLFFSVIVLFMIMPLTQCKKTKPRYSILSKSRTIHIPVQMLSALPMKTENETPEALTFSEGAEDELPQGPQSFDVLEDGGLVIADPLRQRIVFYDSLGNYIDAWHIGFSVNHVARREDGFLNVVSATTGESFLLDETGRLSLLPSSRGEQADERTTKMLGVNKGVIAGPKTRGAQSPAIEVSFSSDSTQMISLQNLGVDAEGNTYVALETTHGQETIDIIKYIRIYSADGKLLYQINDISLDYYIHPNDEFRIKNGMIYQMQPRQSELLIQIWQIR